MLNGDAAAKLGDPVDVAVVDGLGMVEEPMQAVERDVAVDLLEHVQRARDRLVVGGVQPPRPAVLRQQTDRPVRARSPCSAACRDARPGNLHSPPR